MEDPPPPGEMAEQAALGGEMPSPAVGDSAAVPTHSQALLQMGSEAGGSDAPAAIGANTLLALPLVKNLSKDVQPRLVHDLWGQERHGGQGRWDCHTSCSHPWIHGIFSVPEVGLSPLQLTKILHAIRVRVIQEEVATLDSPVHLEAESQTRILHQVSIDLLSDGLGPGGE